MLGMLLQITTAPATESTAVDFTMLFIKMMGALAIVCILAVVILKYAIPKIGVFKRFAGGKYIEVKARHSLDPKKQLYLVKVGPRYALLGASEHGVHLVMELKKEDVEPEEVA